MEFPTLTAIKNRFQVYTNFKIFTGKVLFQFILVSQVHSCTALKLGRKYCQFHIEIILEIPRYLFRRPSFPLDCGMLIIFKQDGWEDLLCPCSSATRRNNFVEKKIGEIVNLKKYLAVILVYLETPKTVPTSFSWEKYGS